MVGGIHVIIGEDDYLVNEAAKRLIGSASVEEIDSIMADKEEPRLRDLVAADASFSTPPFLEPEKVTWWRHVGFLPSGGGKRGGEDKTSEAVKEGLEKFARKLANAHLPPNQGFILSGPRLLMTSVFAKTLKTCAEIIDFSPTKGRDGASPGAGQVQRLKDLAAEAHLAFAPGAAERFLDTVGFDTQTLISEFGKLRDYLDPAAKTVTLADVEEITSSGPSVEPTPWSVTDALGMRDAKALLKAVSRFEGDRSFAILMSSMAEKFLRQLCEFKAAEAAGKLGEAFVGVKPFVAKKTSAFLNRWQLGELRVARFRFVKLRERCVSGASQGGSEDSLVILELLRACRPVRGTK